MFLSHFELVFASDLNNDILHLFHRLLQGQMQTYQDGTKNVRYEKADDDHFFVSCDIELSVQFYGWLCGFGDLVKIISPETAVIEFAAHLDKIRSMY